MTSSSSTLLLQLLLFMISAAGRGHLTTAIENQRICGTRSVGNQLEKYYSGELSNSSIYVRFQPTEYYSYSYSYKFNIKYTVLREGCSNEDLTINATLTPTPVSNSTFTLTCLPRFITSNSTKTQTVECIDGQWTPFLPCQEIPMDVTQLIFADAPATESTAASFTASAFYSSIGSLVAILVVLIVLMVIGLMVFKRRQQPRQRSDATVHRSQNLKACGSSGRDVNYAETRNSLYDETQYDGAAAVKPASLVPVHTSAASRYVMGDQMYSEPDTYELEGPIKREITSTNNYSLAYEVPNDGTTSQIEEGQEVSGIYFNVSESHRKELPPASTENDDPVMVDNDLYVSTH